MSIEQIERAMTQRQFSLFLLWTAGLQPDYIQGECHWAEADLQHFLAEMETHHE